MLSITPHNENGHYNNKQLKYNEILVFLLEVRTGNRKTVMEKRCCL